MRNWTFEKSWAVYSVWAYLAFPWLLALFTVPHLLSIYSQVSFRTMLICCRMRIGMGNGGGSFRNRRELSGAFAGYRSHLRHLHCRRLTFTASHFASRAAFLQAGLVDRACGRGHHCRLKSKHFGQAYAQVLLGLGLHPQLTLNTWAIANWGATFDPGTTAFSDSESNLSGKIIDGNLLFADAVTLPGYNLYRGLTRQVYTKVHCPVPAWPDRAVVEKTHANGKIVYLWPHFIVDDDRGRGATWRKVHFDVRYLKDLAQRSRALGIDGSFMNVYNPGPEMGTPSAHPFLCRLVECLGFACEGTMDALAQRGSAAHADLGYDRNIFAYGQLNRSPDLAVEAILRQFAELIAEPNSVQELTEVFTFLENGSVWGTDMPKQCRLKPLPCRLRSHQEAAVALKSVEPLKS
jgi:hypothetical protein